MGRTMPDCESVWKEYTKGLGFKAALGLNDTVQTNEDFFIGTSGRVSKRVACRRRCLISSSASFFSL